MTLKRIINAMLTPLALFPWAPWRMSASQCDQNLQQVGTKWQFYETFGLRQAPWPT